MSSEARRMKSNEARTNWRDVLDHVRAGGEVVIEHYNRPIARIVPIEEPTMAITLVSALQGDTVPGVEISDPDSPIEWADLPDAARQWAEQQGYGDDDSELLYVLTEGQEPPDGFPTLTVEAYRRDAIHNA